MYNALFDFFSSLFTNYYLTTTYFQFGGIVGSSQYPPKVFTMNQWLSHTCSIISLIFIIVLCCLFVYKIIKLVGNLIR